MKSPLSCRLLPVAVLLSACMAAAQVTRPQPTQRVISLDSFSAFESASRTTLPGEPSYANAPANFYAFPSARVAELAPIQNIRLRFSAATTLTKIESSPDFTVQSGGSCVAGRSYAAGDSCIVPVRFTPQGPGRRSGKLILSHTASAVPEAIGLGGNGYAPVVSFTPAQIITVPGSFPSSKGLLSSAWNLTVDGSDTLYISDTGNNVIRYVNSGATFTTLVSGLTGPTGIAVDNFGDLYFDQPTKNQVSVLWNYATTAAGLNGSGNDACTPSAPCYFYQEAVSAPEQMSMDHNNNLFIVDSGAGEAIEAAVQSTGPNFFYIASPFANQEGYPDAFAVDGSDNQYSFWHAASQPQCEIIAESLYYAENQGNTYTKVAGSRACGFAGDGGQAGNAEISTQVSQIAFDIAGNLYFSDTNNQRVRMISAVSGTITTIAGNGTAGYSGDNSAATGAKLSYPTGIAVDSQGQVYIISGTGTTSGGAQVIRKLNTRGLVSFPGQTEGTTSTAHLVTVANTGNATLTITNVAFTGTNPTAFAIDPATTSCQLTAGAVLYAGQSCQIGVKFTPATTGAMSANLVLLDNTVTNSNTVQLNGTGLATAAVVRAIPIGAPLRPRAIGVPR